MKCVGVVVLGSFFSVLKLGCCVANVSNAMELALAVLAGAILPTCLIRSFRTSINREFFIFSDEKQMKVFKLLINRDLRRRF